MGVSLTLILLAAALPFTALCLWRGQRPATIGKVRYIPWMFLALGGASFSLMLITHLVNMVGIETGGRFG